MSIFRNITLGRRCGREEYEELEPKLRMKLFEAQRTCLERGIPLLITVCGPDGSGRGAVINLLTEWMDAKFIGTSVFWSESDEERGRPLDWRYWRRLPAAGRTGIFYGGWYGEAIRRACCGDLKEHAFNALMNHYRALEMSLADSGMAQVKIWLHLSEKEYESRTKKKALRRDIRNFTPYEAKAAADYGRFLDTASKAITLTDRAKAPWTIIDAADERYRDLTVVRTILHAVDQALAEQDAKKARVAAEKQSGIRPAENVISTLDAIDLSVKADPESAGREIASLQKELRDLTFQAWKKGISTTLLFEGWDAAGKGGAIRRVLSGIDSRLCSVVPISAPTQEELAHHYLWRFWRHMPRAGFVTIFDRTWYGRVLVERVEKITPMEDWSRAYSEINVFEEDLTSTGNVLLKFWLHISPEEQLRRFKERERIPYKQYKITPEDWRNRDKWGDYVAAADEMFLRTNTDYAPWHIVPAEDKKYARIFVLRTYRDALKAALKARRKK